MRTIFRSIEFDEYYLAQTDFVRSKFDYALSIIQQIRVVNTKFVKKVKNTDFYELRISADNEHRVFMFPIKKESIIESDQILLLNGFIKKSTKDYKTRIAIANNILDKYLKR